MKYKFQPLIALLVFFLAACGQPEQVGTKDGRLIVVATNSILADLVSNVGQGYISLVTLVGPDGDSHTFEPSPADSVSLASAVIVFENGLGLESWLDDLYRSSAATGRRVALSQGIEPLTLTTDNGPSESDPHIWHSVANTIIMVEEITAALEETDPPNAAAYRVNGAAYIAQLQELDNWIFTQIERIPAGQRKLVTTHDTFGYFAARYHFEIIGAVLNAASTEVGDPSAGEMAALIETIRASGVPTIFTENISNPGLSQQIANEAGVRLALPLYTDALGQPSSPGGTYLLMMNYNVSTIVEALTNP